MLNYRVGHTVRARFGLPGRVVSGALFWWNRHFYGCAIAPTARIFGGFIVPHPQGITLGPQAVIGPRSWVYQNVTIGGSPTKPGMPTIGSDARIYAGAVIIGPITLGDQCWIGANAVVAKDVDEGTLVRSADGQELPLRLLGLVPVDEGST